VQLCKYLSAEHCLFILSSKLFFKDIHCNCYICSPLTLVYTSPVMRRYGVRDFYWSDLLRMNKPAGLIILCFYRKKCKAGLAYGMGFRNHVTYLLGSSLRKHWTNCCIYFPIIQHLGLESALASLIDSLVR
jgi:hypothetical protein